MSKNLSKEIHKWCINRYGRSKFIKEYPKLRVYQKARLNKKQEKIAGEYNATNNTISVFLGCIKDTEDLIKTIIHEYIHYLQPIESCYEDLMTYYGDYRKHPLEVEAWEIAYKDYKECVNTLTTLGLISG